MSEFVTRNEVSSNFWDRISDQKLLNSLVLHAKAERILFFYRGLNLGNRER